MFPAQHDTILNDDSVFKDKPICFQNTHTINYTLMSTLIIQGKLNSLNLCR